MRRKPKRPIGGDLWGFCRGDLTGLRLYPAQSLWFYALAIAHCQALAHSQAKAHGEAQARDSKNDFRFPILGKPFDPENNPFGILKILKFLTRELDFPGKFFVLLFYVWMSALHYAIRMVM
jgi:hypothetical protein